MNAAGSTDDYPRQPGRRGNGVVTRRRGGLAGGRNLALHGLTVRPRNPGGWMVGV